MPQRFNRLRIHFFVIVGILLALGGSALLVVLSTNDSAGLPPVSLIEDPWEGVDEVIRGRLQEDSTGIALLHGRRVPLHQGVRAFYTLRQFGPVWTDPSARTGVAEELQASADAGLNPADYHADALAELASVEPIADSSRGDLDLLLTSAIFSLADDLSGPRVDVEELYGDRWFASSRTVQVDSLIASIAADSLLADRVTWLFEQLHPRHPEYRALLAEVSRRRSLIEMEDWPVILPGRTLTPGDTSALVPTLRVRLRLEGADLSEPDAATKNIYDSPLAEAVRAFQSGKGLEADGVVSQPTRTALNTRPTASIVPLLQLNMERWRWLPEDLGDFHVLANIPSFDLAVRERDGDRFVEHLRMATVVGKRAWETPVFSDTMTQVIFNPTWTIPASIQRESYGSYRGLMVRQPGPGNPMGRVKFRFPNNLGIYIHDTNSRWAFSRDRRAYSHGCIRAHEPDRLAEEILIRSNEWTPEEVRARFDGPWRLEDVELNRPVPVHIVYFTAWVDESGLLQTYGDVYGHDERLAEALGIELEGDV